MLTKEECKAILQFLDRVAITGHQERAAMNQVVTKVATMMEVDKLPATPARTAAEASD